VAPVLTAVEVVHVRLPLVEPWVTPLGRMVSRDVALVRVVMDGAEGWGECVAQPDPTYSPVDVVGALHVLERHLVPRLMAGRPAGADDVAGILASVKGHRMAKAALEAAVLDAGLRARGVNLADDLHRRSAAGTSRPRPQRVTGGVAVGITSDLGALERAVAGRVAEGYRRVKLKVHPGWDVEPVASVRAAHPTLALQVDANGSYAPLDPGARRRAVGALDPFDLLLVEQPLADDDLVGHAHLAAGVATPICLDEAVTSLEVTDTALALGACRVVNIKPGRVGGLLEAVRIHDRCLAAGVAVWCGGMLETGIGRATNLALATLPGFSLPGDLSAAGRFWADDVVTEPAVLGADGTLAVPSGVGAGVEVADLSRWTVSRRRLA
jgi:O-succinylbenzoate synthase